MPDASILAALLAVGLASYAMRAGGYLLASALPRRGLLPLLLRLAPGNLFVAFTAAGVLEGGWPCLLGCAGAVTAMAMTNREWAALAVGFAVTALAAAAR
jgi:hypothetical protein